MDLIAVTKEKMIRILIIFFLIPLIAVACISQKETTSEKTISEIQLNYSFRHGTVDTRISREMIPVEYVLLYEEY